MSLAVQIKKIVGVLLDDGDWHEVRPGSMAVNKFELADGDDTLVRGGSISGVSCMGLAFKENEGGLMIACPITSVKAVRYRVVVYTPQGLFQYSRYCFSQENR